MHVNALTAEHLDDWLAVLESAFPAGSEGVHFEVPNCYLQTEDARIDLSIVTRVLLGP